jgi:hypothetical protein
MPYGAVTRFYDPSVSFLLQFEANDADSKPGAHGPELLSLHRKEPGEAAPKLKAVEEVHAEAEGEDGPDKDEPKIVSLDQFRKK